MHVETTLKTDEMLFPTLCASSASACGWSKHNLEREMLEGGIRVLTNCRKAKSHQH